ncbi:maleylpyruvate isomerase N-terminal domain-containing protein, partial [Actinomadura adrarensis]
MDTPDYLACLRRDLDAFEGCLSGDLVAPVEHCGDWTLHDLADHLGRGNLWSAAGVTEKRGDHEPEPG